MKKIGVIGAGTMGNGIAHVASLNGFDVALMDVKVILLNRALDVISKNMERQIERGKISSLEKNDALGRISTSIEIDSLSDCDIVIEAATEDPNIKLSIFKQLDSACNDECILATNTSSISITRIGAETKRPEKVIGMHFMNPVPVMKLVEVIKGKSTSSSVVDSVIGLSLKMQKIPVECNDSPGFVANRILMPMINEAIFCFMEGVGTVEAIDDIMKLGMSHPMGPLKLADLIGLDVCYAILKVLHNDFKDDKYKPCLLLKRMVGEGKLGQKSGQGFYNY